MAKTLDVAKIVEQANRMLAAPDKGKICPAFREGVASLLEQILFNTDNYQGFNYLDWVNGGWGRWLADGEPADNTPYLGDQTRRVYNAPETKAKPKRRAAPRSRISPNTPNCCTFHRMGGKSYICL